MPKAREKSILIFRVREAECSNLLRREEIIHVHEEAAYPWSVICGKTTVVASCVPWNRNNKCSKRKTERHYNKSKMASSRNIQGDGDDRWATAIAWWAGVTSFSVRRKKELGDNHLQSWAKSQSSRHGETAVVLYQSKFPHSTQCL